MRESPPRRSPKRSASIKQPSTGQQPRMNNGRPLSLPDRLCRFSVPLLPVPQQPLDPCPRMAFHKGDYETVPEAARPTEYGHDHPGIDGPARRSRGRLGGLKVARTRRLLNSQSWIDPFRGVGQKLPTCFSLTSVHKVIKAPIVIKRSGALESASYSALRRISALITSSTHCFSFSVRGVRVAPSTSFRASSELPLS